MKRETRTLVDHKNWLTYMFWSLVNKILIWWRFRDFQVIGRENLPKSGPFLLVSNHTARWDGLLVYHTIDRPANFMVTPNELKGTQGQVLVSMGSFPADPKANIIHFAQQQLNKGEGVVIFPEGNIFRDGTTHTFKNGASRVILGLAAIGIRVPVIPCAIHYPQDQKVAQMALGTPIDVSEYANKFADQPLEATRDLSQRMHREVCHLRLALGSHGDMLALFHSGARHWDKLIKALAPQLSKPALETANVLQFAESEMAERIAS